MRRRDGRKPRVWLHTNWKTWKLERLLRQRDTGPSFGGAAVVQRQCREEGGSSTEPDSHNPDVHDYIRGVQGAFSHATRGLRLLVAARKRAMPSGRGPLIQAIAVVFDRNVNHLPRYIGFCRALGVDEINLQMLNPTFANRHSSEDRFFAEHFWHQADSRRRALRTIRDVLKRYASDPLLGPSLEEWDWLEQYIASPLVVPSGTVCGSHRRNLMIDSEGEVSFRFAHPEGAESRSVGNVAKRSIADVLSAPAAHAMREHMSACRKACATLNCHRKPKTRTHCYTGSRSAAGR